MEFFFHNIIHSCYKIRTFLMSLFNLWCHTPSSGCYHCLPLLLTQLYVPWQIITRDSFISIHRNNFQYSRNLFALRRSEVHTGLDNNKMFGKLIYTEWQRLFPSDNFYKDSYILRSYLFSISRWVKPAILSFLKNYFFLLCSCYF